MPLQGIPPSLDRIQFRRRVFFASSLALLLLFIVGALFFESLSDPDPGHLDKGLPGFLDDGTALQSAQESNEENRDAAFAAMRYELEVLLSSQDVAGVFWRENRHTAQDGDYFFEGIVDAEFSDKRVERYPYLVEMIPDSERTWVVRRARIGEPGYALLEYDGGSTIPEA